MTDSTRPTDIVNNLVPRKMDGKHKPFIDPKADDAPPPSFLEATSSAAGPSGSSLSSRTRLACVSLHMNDRIRFLNFSTEEIRSLRDGLTTVWSIQDVRSYGGAEEFKFKNYPWLGKANGDDQSRRHIKRMLQTLYDMGWVLQAAVDISKKSFDEGWSQCPKCKPPLFRPWQTD